MRPADRDRLLSLRWRVTTCVAIACISTIAIVLVAEEAAALNQPAQPGSQPQGGADSFGNPLSPGTVYPGRPGRASAVSGGS